MQLTSIAFPKRLLSWKASRLKKIIFWSILAFAVYYIFLQPFLDTLVAKNLQAIFAQNPANHYFYKLEFAEKRRYFSDGKSYKEPCIQFTAKKEKNVKISSREKFQLRELTALQKYSFLSKKVFDSRPKVVFIAGLEATGHHFIRSAWNNLCGNLTNICTKEDGFTRMVIHKPQRNCFLSSHSPFPFFRI